MDEFGNVAWDIFETVDSGIDAIEAGHQLPLEEAFQRVSELRESRRSTKR